MGRTVAISVSRPRVEGSSIGPRKTLIYSDANASLSAASRISPANNLSEVVENESFHQPVSAVLERKKSSLKTKFHTKLVPENTGIAQVDSGLSSKFRKSTSFGIGLSQRSWGTQQPLARMSNLSALVSNTTSARVEHQEPSSLSLSSQKLLFTRPTPAGEPHDTAYNSLSSFRISWDPKSASRNHSPSPSSACMSNSTGLELSSKIYRESTFNDYFRAFSGTKMNQRLDFTSQQSDEYCFHRNPGALSSVKNNFISMASNSSSDLHLEQLTKQVAQLQHKLSALDSSLEQRTRDLQCCLVSNLSLQKHKDRLQTCKSLLSSWERPVSHHPTPTTAGKASSNSPISPSPGTDTMSAEVQERVLMEIAQVLFSAGVHTPDPDTQHMLARISTMSTPKNTNS